MASTSTVALSEAKAGLSSLVREASESGASYVITVRNVPLAMIVPMPKPRPKALKAFGVLSHGANAEARAKEEGAWARAVEEKHANVARH